MAEAGMRHRGEVVESHVVAALEQRSDLPRENERLQAARAGAVSNVAANRVQLGAVGMRGRDQPRRVTEDVFGDGYLSRHPLSGDDGLRISDRMELWKRVAGRAPSDLGQFGLARKMHQGLEQKAAELTLRNWGPPLQLARLLRPS